MSIKDMESDFGIGLRVKLPIGLVIGLDVARSRDGIKSSFNFGHGF